MVFEMFRGLEEPQQRTSGMRCIQIIDKCEQKLHDALSELQMRWPNPLVCYLFLNSERMGGDDVITCFEDVVRELMKEFGEEAEYCRDRLHRGVYNSHTERSLRECIRNARIISAYADKPLRLVAPSRDEKFLERCRATNNPSYQMDWFNNSSGALLELFDRRSA